MLQIKRYLSNLLLSCFLLNVLGLGLMILRGLMVKTGQLVDLEQTALERQDLSHTYLALHELESKFIVSIVYVFFCTTSHAVPCHQYVIVAALGLTSMPQIKRYSTYDHPDATI